MHYRIGSRGSELALAQAGIVKKRLEEAYPQDSYEIVTIRTTGDIKNDRPVDAIGGKGIFTDMIEKGLLEGSIHLAVHSMKDMPDRIPDELAFSKPWEREDPRDVLILKGYNSLEELPDGAVIGTGSKRRAFQLKKIRSGLKVINIRGNVDTRIRKLFHPGLDKYGNQEPEMDGIIVAAAGLKRLGRESEITQYLPPEIMVPAPAQGALAIELRKDNLELMDRLNRLADPGAETAIRLERGFQKAIGGDCRLPAGAYYSMKEDRFYALFGSEDGSRLERTEIDCGGRAVEDADRIVKEAAARVMPAAEEAAGTGQTAERAAADMVPSAPEAGQTAERAAASAMPDAPAEGEEQK